MKSISGCAHVSRALKSFAVLVALIYFVFVPDGRAAISWWDKAGNLGSYSTYTAGSLAGTWETSTWSSLDKGQATPVAWTEGNAAGFAVGAGATNAGNSASTTAFTVTMNSPHTIAGFFDGALNPNSCIVTLSGSGAITLPAGQNAFDFVNSSDSSLGQIIINNTLTGPGQITLEGNGQVYLNGGNTFSGGVTFGYSATTFSGILNFNSVASFGTGSIILSNTAALTSALVAEGSGAITVTNSVVIMTTNNPSWNIVGTPAGVTFSGPWNLGPKTLSLGSGVAGNLVTISGAISGTGGLIKFNPATLVLSGPNTYSGATTVNGGILSINSDARLGAVPGSATAGSVTLNGGTLQQTAVGAGITFINGNRGVAIGASGGTIDIPTSGTIQIYTSGQITGSGNVLTKTGAGTFRNTTPTSITFSKLVVTGGLYQAGSDTYFGAVPGSILADAITLNGGGIGINSGITFSANRGITLGAGGGEINTSSQLIYPGVITGSGGLTKTGTSPLFLAGANNYTGPTTVSVGSLTLNSGGSIGASAVTVASAATLANGSTTTRTIGGATTLSSGALAAFNATGGSSTTVGKISITGPLTLNNNAMTVTVGGSALAAGSYRLLDCTGTLSGSAGALTIAGTALSAGYTASLSTTTGVGGHVDLVVKATPAFSGLTASPSIIYGAASVTLNGTVSSVGGPSTVFAASGDTVSATINGHTVNGTVSGSSGVFTIVYNDPSLATDNLAGSPYTITYAYGGSAAAFLNAAPSDSSTSMAVNKRPVILTGTRAYDGTTAITSGILSVANLVGGDVVTVTSGSATLAAAQAGSESISSLGTLTIGGASVANYTLTGGSGSVTVTAVPLSVTANPSFATGGRQASKWLKKRQSS